MRAHIWVIGYIGKLKICKQFWQSVVGKRVCIDGCWVMERQQNQLYSRAELVVASRYRTGWAWASVIVTSIHTDTRSKHQRCDNRKRDREREERERERKGWERPNRRQIWSKVVGWSMVHQTTSNNASLNWSPHHEHQEGERESGGRWYCWEPLYSWTIKGAILVSGSFFVSFRAHTLTNTQPLAISSTPNIDQTSKKHTNRVTVSLPNFYGLCLCCDITQPCVHQYAVWYRFTYIEPSQNVSTDAKQRRNVRTCRNKRVMASRHD